MKSMFLSLGLAAGAWAADDTSKPPPTGFVTTPGSGYMLVRFEPPLP